LIPKTYDRSLRDRGDLAGQIDLIERWQHDAMNANR
jgi:hypothetical protein